MEENKKIRIHKYTEEIPNTTSNVEKQGIYFQEVSFDEKGVNKKEVKTHIVGEDGNLRKSHAIHKTGEETVTGTKTWNDLQIYKNGHRRDWNPVFNNPQGLIELKDFKSKTSDVNNRADDIHIITPFVSGIMRDYGITIYEYESNLGTTTKRASVKLDITCYNSVVDGINLTSHCSVKCDLPDRIKSIGWAFTDDTRSHTVIIIRMAKALAYPAITLDKLMFRYSGINATSLNIIQNPDNYDIKFTKDETEYVNIINALPEQFADASTYISNIPSNRSGAKYTGDLNSQILKGDHITFIGSAAVNKPTTVNGMLISKSTDNNASGVQTYTTGYNTGNAVNQSFKRTWNFADGAYEPWVKIWDASAKIEKQDLQSVLGEGNKTNLDLSMISNERHGYKGMYAEREMGLTMGGITFSSIVDPVNMQMYSSSLKAQALDVSGFYMKVDKDVQTAYLSTTYPMNIIIGNNREESIVISENSEVNLNGKVTIDSGEEEKSGLFFEKFKAQENTKEFLVLDDKGEVKKESLKIIGELEVYKDLQTDDGRYFTAPLKVYNKQETITNKDVILCIDAGKESEERVLFLSSKTSGSLYSEGLISLQKNSNCIISESIKFSIIVCWYSAETNKYYLISDNRVSGASPGRVDFFNKIMYESTEEINLLKLSEFIYTTANFPSDIVKVPIIHK